MQENQRQILDNFFHIKDLKFRDRYQVCYSVKNIKELEDAGIAYMGDNITIEIYRDVEESLDYLRVMLDGKEWTLLEVPAVISRAFANYLGFRLYSILYILPSEDALDIMNDLRTDFLYQ